MRYTKRRNTNFKNAFKIRKITSIERLGLRMRTGITMTHCLWLVWKNRDKTKANGD